MIEKKTYSPLFIFLVIVCFFLVAGVFIYQQTNKQSDPIKPISTFDVDPVKPTTASEPVVTSWKSYSNDQYQFAMNIPAEWNEQKYPALQPNGGTFIAFSPDPLPCETCSYFHDGYFSIRIYNQKTYPEYYVGFVQRMNNIGRNKEYQSVNLGREKGVFFANIIAAQHQGWVYELALDTNGGNAKITDSEIFLKVASSLTFTDLSFTQ